MALFVLGGLIYLTVRSAEFLAQIGYPSGYFYDLGIHIMATSLQATAIHSLSDLLDCVGWAAWGDAPEFAYNPMTTSTVLVAMVKLGASPTLAVKLGIVTEFWLALLSMTALYRTLRRSWWWALVAGILYAFLPATSLLISGNLDLGFSIALLPFGLWAGFALVRRFRFAGLVLAGAICGFVGQGFSPEYFFVGSIPAFAWVAERAYTGRDRLRWAASTMLGVACSIGIGLFWIFPTLGSSNVFSSPAARIVESEYAGVRIFFGESLTALSHAVLTESLLSPVTEFNVSTLLWSTSFALTILWWAALAFANRRLRRGGDGRRQAILIILLLVLAFGSALPYAATFWAGLSYIPVVQFLRTPDRLVALPFVFLVFWGVAFIQSIDTLNRRKHVAQAMQLVAPIALLVVLVSFAYFDLIAGGLLVRPTAPYRLPDLASANAAARAQGGPAASYAFVRDGSVLDTPLYGEGLLTRIVVADLFSRYGSEPTHAVGMLQKAGIRTIITTPPWSFDSSSWPNLNVAYYASKDLTRTWRSPLGVSVWQTKRPVPEVSATRLACLHGGPALLDILAMNSDLQGYALTGTSAACAIDIYSNYDPRDASIAGATAVWSGTTLRVGLPQLDHDYSAITTRTLVARPWYRNAIEGDTPAFGPAAALMPGRSLYAKLDTNVAENGHYVLSVRLTLPTQLCVDVTADHRARYVRCAGSSAGLHWISMTMPLREGPHEFDLVIHPRARMLGLQGAILDGILLTSERPMQLERKGAHGSIFIYSSAWLRNDRASWSVWLEKGRYLVSLLSPKGLAMRDRASLDGRAIGGSAIVSKSGFHALRIRPKVAAIVFATYGAYDSKTPGKAGIERSVASWNVRVTTPEAIRATVTNDGWWTLDSERTHLTAFDCDLVDTCFGIVPRGQYVLHHRWPRPLVLGIVLSLLTWIVAATPCAIAVFRQRRRKGLVRG